ncbi:MAG TPA: hypothetical protein P5120_06855 [Spirochaetota bacterium]|nr:hypothetical protein [Spirochaetota bacterium]HPJ42279.1 hypothetical protein [Spirochaetota bacterium]HPR37012.1 hypothetical protein [Spirochaetota bacterium]HRX47220.1 hypothetical protein [Spirochaetota bacterium]
MDPDISHIIDEDERLARELKAAEESARERVEIRRREMADLRAAEFSRIEAEYRSMSEKKLQEIKCGMANRLKEARQEQERLLDDERLKNKITGRIVSVILDNRT